MMFELRQLGDEYEYRRARIKKTGNTWTAYFHDAIICRCADFDKLVNVTKQFIDIQYDMSDSRYENMRMMGSDFRYQKVSNLLAHGWLIVDFNAVLILYRVGKKYIVTSKYNSDHGPTYEDEPDINSLNVMMGCVEYMDKRFKESDFKTKAIEDMLEKIDKATRYA